MKRNRLKEAVALAICTCTLAGSAAYAQSGTERTVRSWSEMSTLGIDNGSFVVERFDIQNNQLVAYGRLVPTSSVSTFDASRLGSWTGIGTGYGESGVESRSTLRSSPSTRMSTLVRRNDNADLTLDARMGPTSGNDRVASGLDVHFGPTSGNDRVARGIDIQFGPTSGNDRIASDIDVRMGPTSANDRTAVDLKAGATSANDRTVIDAELGATSANDRTAIDLKFGPTSGNDRVASGGIDLKVGPTSGNDRTTIDARMGPTSANDRTRLDARMGTTSANDRTSVDLNVGTTRGNDRVAGLSVSQSVVVPVTVLSASCNAVRLSFGSSDPVVVTSVADARSDVRSTLCAVASANASDQHSALAEHLNSLIR